MIGTILFLLLFVALVRRLPDRSPAERVALASVLALACPVVVLSVLARFGIGAGAVATVCTFLVLIGVNEVSKRRPPVWPSDSRWLNVTILALTIATLSALLGRPPTLGVIVDPWAHMAWSRDLPSSLRLYPPGFPALYAVLGLDDRLLGAFRMAPVLLHFALTAQFLALSERFGRMWPGAVAALTYLVVPVAFGKFEPPRPELMAAVFVTASWWILLSNHPGKRWKPIILAFLTCALLVSHVSILEAAYLVALAAAILLGNPEGAGAKRTHLLFAVLVGVAVSLLVSPFPLWLLLKPETGPVIADRFRPITVPGLIDVARMWGLALGFASMAGILWVVAHFRMAYREARGVLFGQAMWFVLILSPVFLASVGVQLPNTLATYRYFLSAALPLAFGVTAVAGLAQKTSVLCNIGVALCACIFAVDVCFRPTFSVLNGAIAVGLIVAMWRIGRQPRSRAVTGATVIAALVCAVGVRLIIWYPSPPPEVRWLTNDGDRQTTVVSNWPSTNTLDALVPQPVLDGLAGEDANLGLHRALVTTKLRDRLSWCGQIDAPMVDTVRTVLDEMDALPAYLVVGDRFGEAWRVYSEQRERPSKDGRPMDRPFFAAEPCSEDAKLRIEKIRGALEKHPDVRREFSSETVSIYRIQ